MSTPRGIRNCNPLNIERTATQWQGMRPKQTDKRFCQFISMEYGYRAAFKTLFTYAKKHNLHTIREWITRWAPPSENDTAAYIRVVCTRAGLDSNVPISICDAEKMTAVVAAMAYMENGIEAVMEEVVSGFEMAFVYG